MNLIIFFKNHDYLLVVVENPTPETSVPAVLLSSAFCTPDIVQPNFSAACVADPQVIELIQVISLSSH